MEEEKEALFALHAFEEAHAPAESPLDVGIGRVGGVAPLGEAALEAVAALHVTALDVAGGAETGVGEDLRQGADLGRQNARRGKTPCSAG